MMLPKQVYVGLGGNVGDSAATLQQALEEISKIEGVTDLQCSKFYQTSPVSAIPQDDYINAVCTFKATLTVKSLHRELQRIEKKLGKIPKVKDAPRVVDLDLLLFGTEGYRDDSLQVPHRCWQERMFVLVPLADLVTELTIPDTTHKVGARQVNIKEMLENFTNIHQERVRFHSDPYYSLPTAVFGLKANV